MDVRKLLGPVALVFLLANCGNKDSSNTNESFAKPDNAECEEQRVPGEYLVRWQSGEVSVVHAPDESSFINGFMERHKHEIQMAEPHYRVKISEPIQVSTRAFKGALNWGLEKIQAHEVWQQGYDGSGIVVAVIDSGLDMTHPELQNIVAINEGESVNGKDDDGNGLIDDLYGYDFALETGEMTDNTSHGTHVTGIIAANHSAGQRLGVAPGAKILPLNFIDETGSGLIDSAIRSMRYAADRGARVINASWGGPACSQTLRAEIDILSRKGVLFVSAAGNSGKNIGVDPEFPAAFELDNHISVGASTVDDFTAGFSNYGVPVAVLAPGTNIKSTIPLVFDSPNSEGVRDGLGTLDGTSMAAPFVAGVAAVLWSARPEATFSKIKQAILNGIVPGNYPVATRGQVNLKNSMEWLLTHEPPSEEDSADPPPEDL